MCASALAEQTTVTTIIGIFPLSFLGLLFSQKGLSYSFEILHGFLITKILGFQWGKNWGLPYPPKKANFGRTKGETSNMTFLRLLCRNMCQNSFILCNYTFKCRLSFRLFFSIRFTWSTYISIILIFNAQLRYAIL